MWVCEVDYLESGLFLGHTNYLRPDNMQNKTSPECLNKIAKVNKLSDFANYILSLEVICIILTKHVEEWPKMNPG